MKVLIVDDSAAMRAVLRTILKSNGHEVVGEASNGESAMPMISRLRPEIITLDLVMPGLSGFELLAEIRRIAVSSHTVIVSGTDDRTTIKQALELGAIDYVIKPFNPKQVLRVFDRLLIAKNQTSATPIEKCEKTMSGKRCVLVEDNRSIRLLLKSILSEAGILVVAEAEDGMEGLKAIDRELPDFICLDIDMPRLDGMNTLRCLRAIHTSLPVIIITSRDDRENISRAIEYRVNGYLIKPFDPNRVLVTIRKLFADHTL